MHYFTTGIMAIGHHGPVIVVLFAVWQLWLVRPELYWFLIGFTGNELTNEYLKLWFKEPRPKNQIKFIDHDDLHGAHEYGMPSGHAQGISFAIVFIYALTSHIEWLYMTVPLWLLTCVQRWSLRRHTAKQIAVGSFVGGSLGYFTYWTMHLCLQ